MSYCYPSKAMFLTNLDTVIGLQLNYLNFPDFLIPILEMLVKAVSSKVAVEV